MEVQVHVLSRGLANLVHYCPKCGCITRPTPEYLTERELEILQDVGLGMNTQAITKKRFINIKTVERHIQNIRKKLNIDGKETGEHNMVLLAREALRMGLVTL